MLIRCVDDQVGKTARVFLYISLSLSFFFNNTKVRGKQTSLGAQRFYFIICLKISHVDEDDDDDEKKILFFLHYYHSAESVAWFQRKILRISKKKVLLICFKTRLKREASVSNFCNQGKVFSYSLLCVVWCSLRQWKCVFAWRKVKYFWTQHRRERENKSS